MPPTSKSTTQSTTAKQSEQERRPVEATPTDLDPAKQDEQRDSAKTAARTAPVEGGAIRVIRDGGVWDHPATLTNVGQDDEALRCTICTAVADPESSERIHLPRVLLVDNEDEARARSAVERVHYFAWVVQLDEDEPASDEV